LIVEHGSVPDQRDQGYHHLASALKFYRGRIAVLSSFGADAAVLLAMVAELDRDTPILFLETGRHFGETLAYRQELTTLLGLTDVRDISPLDAGSIDPSGELWYYDPDACCALRKVRPLNTALRGFDAWITGRKRHQALTRAELPHVERHAGRTKINPLLDWTLADIEAEFVRRDLPRHPLVAKGYASIGCAPCTRPVVPGQDVRAGRWAHAVKTECGIHLASPGQ
jgi:phosphoadenosine phosphosulfate reductase